MAEDLTSVDFFRDRRLTDDPFPFYEALRNKCPVSREDHYGVTMVTGWQEAVDVYNDAETFSSCISVTGPFPGFPVPLEGDDVTELIEQAPRRDSVQRPAADAGPADAHQSPRPADAADHAQAPQGERGRDVAARRRDPRRLPGAG